MMKSAKVCLQKYQPWSLYSNCVIKSKEIQLIRLSKKKSKSEHQLCSWYFQHMLENVSISMPMHSVHEQSFTFSGRLGLRLNLNQC